MTTPIQQAEQAVAKVVTQTGPRIKTLFQGLESDARKFIEQFFPRSHVEPPSRDPGVPDAVLVKADGSKEHYHSEAGWAPGTGNPDEPATPAPAPAPAPDTGEMS